MKTTSLILAIAGFLAIGMAGTAFAADKEVTISGDGKCAKCALTETEACQNAIQVTENGKTVTYYLAQNDVSKAFHKNLCKETKKVTATGTVAEENGKKTMTVSKIDLAK